MIVTNDKELIQTQLDGGVPKANRLTGDPLKLIRKNNYAGYWNAPKLFNKLKDPALGLAGGMEETLQQLESMLGEGTIQGVKKEGDLLFLLHSDNSSNYSHSDKMGSHIQILNRKTAGFDSFAFDSNSGGLYNVSYIHIHTRTG